MKFKRSYKLEVEDIAQKHDFSTHTPTGLNYTVVHNSKEFSRYTFGDWEDERIVQIHFDGHANDPKVDMQKIKVYREGIEKDIEPFIEDTISELHDGKEEPQAMLVATKAGKDTRYFKFNRREIKPTIK